jgi:hypothetical protein
MFQLRRIVVIKEKVMDTAGIIETLESEKKRIDTALVALQGISSRRERGKALNKSANRRRGKRHMSAAARNEDWRGQTEVVGRAKEEMNWLAEGPRKNK